MSFKFYAAQRGLEIRFFHPTPPQPLGRISTGAVTYFGKAAAGASTSAVQILQRHPEKIHILPDASCQRKWLKSIDPWDNDAWFLHFKPFRVLSV